jgi:hypothetical protein
MKKVDRERKTDWIVVENIQRFLVNKVGVTHNRLKKNYSAYFGFFKYPVIAGLVITHLAS